MTNLTMYMNIKSFPQLQKTATAAAAAAQPSTGHSQEGTGEEDEGVNRNDQFFVCLFVC
jgi:hypothetical protein